MNEQSIALLHNQIIGAKDKIVCLFATHVYCIFVCFTRSCGYSIRTKMQCIPPGIQILDFISYDKIVLAAKISIDQRVRKTIYCNNYVYDFLLQIESLYLYIHVYLVRRQ